jgi:thioesterase domain-containing protein
MAASVGGVECCAAMLDTSRGTTVSSLRHGSLRPKGRRMTQGSAGLNTSRLVVLHEGGEGKPLFVFPGVHGEPEAFHDMASRLGERRQVYGFRHIGAQNECEPVRQISRFAQLYAADLRRAEPRGPYYLFGYSFGGVVAFEVARELKSQGQSVALVILADCPAPGYPKLAPPWRRAKTHLRSLLTGSPSSRAQYLVDRLSNMSTRIWRLLGFDPDAAPLGAGPTHMLHVNAALYEAYQYYRPTPQCVDVLFLTAQTPPDWPTVVFDDPLLGWGPWLRGRISQVSVPGTHLSIFAPQNIVALTDRIRHVLAHADRERNSQTENGVTLTQTT